MLAYPCLDFKGIWNSSFYCSGPSYSKWLVGEKLKWKLTSSSPLMPPTGYRVNPLKTLRSMCPHAMSGYVGHSSFMAGSWWEQCLPGTKDLLSGDQRFRSWLFHRDVFLHPLWNQTHISSYNTTQLFLPSGYVRGKYSTNNFFTVRIFALRRITKLPLLS